MSVIDHRKSEKANDDGSVYEVYVEWDPEHNSSDEKYQWVPFTQIYKEIPQIVQEYFSLKKVSLEAILNEEVQNRMKNGKKNFVKYQKDTFQKK